MPRQARQKIGRPDVGKKADADFRHGKDEIVAADAMRAMQRNADAAAHDDAVDQRDIGLGIGLDAAVEDIFLRPEPELAGVIGGFALFVKQADVAAGAEGAPLALRDDEFDLRIMLPKIERPGDFAHHIQGQRIERLWPIERDEAGFAAFFEQDFGFGRFGFGRFGFGHGGLLFGL